MKELKLKFVLKISKSSGNKLPTIFMLFSRHRMNTYSWWFFLGVGLQCRDLMYKTLNRFSLYIVFDFTHKTWSKCTCSHWIHIQKPYGWLVGNVFCIRRDTSVSKKRIRVSKRKIVYINKPCTLKYFNFNHTFMSSLRTVVFLALLVPTRRETILYMSCVR